MSVLHLTFPLEELRREWDEYDVVKGSLKPLCPNHDCGAKVILARYEHFEGVDTALFLKCRFCELEKQFGFEEIRKNQLTLPYRVLNCGSCQTELWHDTENDEWRCVFCD